MTIELMLFEALMMRRRRELEETFGHAGYGLSWKTVSGARPRKLRPRRGAGLLGLRRLYAARELHVDPNSSSTRCSSRCSEKAP
jgi:hypothetical protein